MVWHQLSVITDENTAPIVADFFSDLGAVSVTYMDAEDEPVYEPAIGETKIWAHTQVIALYELTANPAKIQNQVSGRFQQETLTCWKVEMIEDQVWERAWMEHYRPMKFADRLWVCPSGQEVKEEHSTCLILDPGLAFGTGTHPTTALCLEWLASDDLTGKTVIDYGCGSGILAIAAVLLGAKLAYAVDIDPQALTATIMNAEKNQVREKILCFLPDQFVAENVKANVILANILAKPLADMAGQISALVAQKGQLILSGILTEQAEVVIGAYQSNFLMDKIVQQEDWVRLTGTKH